MEDAQASAVGFVVVLRGWPGPGPARLRLHVLFRRRALGLLPSGQAALRLYGALQKKNNDLAPIDNALDRLLLMFAFNYPFVAFIANDPTAMARVPPDSSRRGECGGDAAFDRNDCFGNWLVD